MKRKQRGSITCIRLTAATDNTILIGWSQNTFFSNK